MEEMSWKLLAHALKWETWQYVRLLCTYPAVSINQRGFYLCHTGLLKQFHSNWLRILCSCNIVFPSVTESIWGKTYTRKLIIGKEEMQRSRPSLQDRYTCSGCHILCIDHNSRTEMSGAHNIYCYMCWTFCFRGELSHANFCLGVSQKPLAGFKIITIMHGFKSFCFGIKSHSFTDFEQMFRTLRRKMAAQ